MPTLDTLRETAKRLGPKYGVDSIYLFGSYATGTARPSSDVDLRVNCGAVKTLLALSQLRLDFVDSLGLDVDLLPTDSLEPEFLNRIQNEEVLLYAAD